MKTVVIEDGKCRCGSNEFVLYIKTDKNDNAHIRVDCIHCHLYQRSIPRTTENLELVDWSYEKPIQQIQTSSIGTPPSITTDLFPD